MTDLEKIAARAGLRLISRLVRQGTPEALMRADRLARTTGVVKPSIYGSQIGKHLGQGGEGIASLVADPEFGLSVRKAYNPRSTLASPRMIGRKAQLSKDVQHPNLAEVQGSRRTSTGGRMSFNKYVPKSLYNDMSPLDLKESQDIARAKLEAAAKAKGWALGDVRDVNFVGDTLVDPMVFRKGEYTRMKGEGNVVGLTPKGRRATGQKGRVVTDPATGEQHFQQHHFVDAYGKVRPKTMLADEDMNRLFFPQKTKPSFRSPGTPLNVEKSVDSKLNTQTMIKSQHGEHGLLARMWNKVRGVPQKPSLPGQPPLPGKTTAQWNSIGGDPGVNPTRMEGQSSPQTAPKPPAPPSPNTPPSGKLKPPKAPSIDWGSRA